MKSHRNEKPGSSPNLFPLPDDVAAVVAQRHASFLDACRPVTEKLRQLGLKVTGVDESLHQYLPLKHDVVVVLLQSLPDVDDWRVVEWIARYIGTAKEPYDGRPLAQAFDRCPDTHVKWAIGDALSRSKPQYIEAWIAQALRTPSHDFARQMLCLAAARILPADVANEALLACFDDVPGHAAMALRKTGGARELEFLRSKHGQWTRWQAKTVEKAILGIEKRLAKQSS